MSIRDKVIPEGYMTVGELAKKMDVTVRTLQYYDKEGLLSPTTESEGGRRLYTDKDMIELHQILSLKSLGFSLNDIKRRLHSLDTPESVAEVLSEQACAVRERIERLSWSLAAIEALKAEVVQIQSVDFKKYADIIVNLQMKNDMYWAIKHFDENTLNNLRARFDKVSGSAFMDEFKRLLCDATQLGEENISPESLQGQEYAENFWNMIMEFTDGDMSILPSLIEIHKNSEMKEKELLAFEFTQKALEVYFTAINYNPFEEGSK